MKVSCIAGLMMFFLSLLLLAEDFKIAHFDVRRVFNEWKNSVESQKLLEEKQKALEEENEARLERIGKLEEERTAVQEEYQKNKASMDREQKLEVDRKFRSLWRDSMALEQDRRDFMEKSLQMLSREKTNQANLILDRIKEEVKLYAVERKFAMVVESGGQTTSHTSFFLHLEGAADITDELIERLNDKED